MRERSEDSMNIKRKFGVEIEYVGIERKHIINALKKINVKCVSERYTHKTATYWKIVDDGSIVEQPQYRGELVSPPLKGSKGLKQLGKVVQAINNAGANVNRSCGLHVHVDASDLSPNQILYVSQRYGKFEKEIDQFMAPWRSNNTYARTLNKTYHTNVARMIRRNMKIHGVNFKSAASFADRYRKVNIASFNRHGTIEFRQHEGTVDFERIINWVQFCIYFVEETCNNVRQNEHVKLSSKIKNSLFHEIPSNVIEYYNNFTEKSLSSKTDI